MKLTHLRDIIAVAETGSLRAAGRQLGIAQPAITRSIREIEREVGISLFHRSARGVQLTEAGRTFLRRAEAIQAEVRRAHDEMEQLKGKATGEVSIAVSTASSMSLLPKAVAEFRKRHPDAVLKISESFFAPVERELLDGLLDFYVGPFDFSTATRLSVERLFDNRRMVVARRGHELVGARSLAEVAHARWIRPALSSRNTEGDFDVMFESAGLPPPKIVIHARSALTTIVTLANSDLLTVLPQQWVDFPMTAALIEPLKIAPVGAAPMCIVRRPDMPLTPLAEYLCDMLRRAGVHFSHNLEQD